MMELAPPSWTKSRHLGASGTKIISLPVFPQLEPKSPVVKLTCTGGHTTNRAREKLRPARDRSASLFQFNRCDGVENVEYDPSFKGVAS